MGRSKIDLIDDDRFWTEAFERFKGCDMRLPVENNRWAVRVVLDEIDCRAEGCDHCCRHYKNVQVTQADIDRLQDRCGVNIHDGVNNLPGGGMRFDITGGCRFLARGGCSVYQYRPDGCYFIPLQFGHNYHPDGSEKDANLYIRIECKPAMRAVREIMRRALRATPGATLSRDLRITA